MSKKKELEIDLETVVGSFARTVTPLPLEREQNGNGNMVIWGDDNLYPNFLMELYENVPLHASIVNSKVDYLIGDGMVEKATGKPLSSRVSEAETNDEYANKLAYDIITFGWIVIAVQYNVFGKPTGKTYHVPGNKVRTNKSKSRFWMCEDWYRDSMNALSYDVFKKGISEGGKTKYYMYKPYTPSVQNVYPSIRYGSSIVNMVTERLINDFGKNNLEDGFSAAHIISFFKGMGTTDAGKKFSDKVKLAYSGVSGQKYIIDFNNPPTEGMPAAPVKVETIESPDYSAKLDGVNKKNETNILASHQAPSRALFAIEQAAGLNGNDLETAYAIFKSVWVRNFRNNLESGINALRLSIGLSEIEFKDRGFIIPKNLADTTKEKVYTINELREIDNKPPRPDGDKYLTIAAPIPVSGSGFASFSNTQSQGRILTEDDFEQVKELGVSKSEFSVLDETSEQDFRKIELLFDDASDIESWLLENDVDSMTSSEIRAAIRKELGIAVTTSEITNKIKALNEAGIIGEEPKKSITRDVQVLYEYDVREGYGAKLIKTSRGFCKKLIGNDRFYTRQDIQQMGAIFGYDVYKHCGGWYHNPDTDKNESQCRHYWKTVRAIKKSK